MIALFSGLSIACYAQTEVELPGLESLEIRGMVRIRGEFKDPVNYSSDHPDDRILSKINVHLDGKINRHLSTFLEFQDSRLFGEELSDFAIGDLEGVDLHQGYINFTDIMDVPLSVKAGRMAVPAFGDQRIISPLPWHNVGRAWDGIHGTYAPENWILDLFSANLAEGAYNELEAGEDHVFSGLYASYLGTDCHEFDAYLIHRDNTGDMVTGSGVDDRKDLTGGIRGKREKSGFDYSGEFIYQTGEQGSSDVAAWAAAVTGGYTLDHSWSPRIGAEFSIASGDDNSTDNDIGTFDPLLPFAHNYNGHMDLIAWRNVQAFKVTLEAKPEKNLSIHLDSHMFLRAEENDSWYGVGFEREPAGSSERLVGYEMDLYTKFKVCEAASFWIGWSHFFPGDFVEESGFDTDGDFLFVMTTVRF